MTIQNTQTIRQMIKYTANYYRNSCGLNVDTVVLRDSEFETLSQSDVCFIEGVRIIPESYLLDDSSDGEDNPDIGEFVYLLRK